MLDNIMIPVLENKCIINIHVPEEILKEEG